MIHRSTLVGRIFIIASFDATKNWNGDIPSNDEEETDYESLDNFLSYEEGDLTLMKKTMGSMYYLYVSMSSKVEIFTTENGIVVCDGLYFNMSWDYSKKLLFNTIGKIDIDFEVTDETIYIYDATLDGKTVILPETDSRQCQDTTSITLTNGTYSVFRVETNILIEGQDVILKGIMLGRQGEFTSMVSCTYPLITRQKFYFC